MGQMKDPDCDEICLARKYALLDPLPQKEPCVGRCYVIKRGKLKTDKHLDKMISNWKNKRSCVGICYLIKVRMMKDKKYRRGLQSMDIERDEKQTSSSEKSLDSNEMDYG